MVAQIWVLLKESVDRFLEDEALMRGAAIAFYTVTSIGPVLFDRQVLDRTLPRQQHRGVKLWCGRRPDNRVALGVLFGTDFPVWR